MALTLYAAPAGAGKTAAVLEKICARQRAQPLARALVILPSNAHTLAARQRLAKQPAQLGVTLLEFDTLYREILDAAGIAVQSLTQAARYRLLRALLRERAAAGALVYFAPIADQPGLIDAFAQFISDVKRARLTPETLHAHATLPRMRDLAAVYDAYQKFLYAKNLADDQGRGWLALNALQADATLYAEFDYIAVDGFDEFDPTQAALLQALAARTPQLDLTLTYQAGRAAHARFERVLAQFPDAARETLPATAPPRRGVLEHLERALFESAAPRLPCDDSIQLVAAADRLREVQAIARAVKRAIIAGAAPSDLAVLFRSLDMYQPLVREVFTAYDIPFRVRGGMALLANALIAEIINLLGLAANDFPRRETMDALRAPYFLWRDLDAQALADLDRITREAVVVRGRAAFLDSFVKPRAPLSDREIERRRVAELDAATLAAYRAWLETFFERVTPPATATVAQYVEWVERLLGPDPQAEEYARARHPETFAAETSSLRVVERVRAADPETAARDLAALCAFKRALGGLVQAAQMLQEPVCARQAFLQDLRDALANATYDLTPAFDGRVLVTGALWARGVSRQMIFLGGLVEGEFPARAPEDVLLTESERQKLEAAGLTRASFHASDEKTYFYQAVALAREKLFLFYPQRDQDARLLNPSPYVGDVCALFQDLTPAKIGLADAPVASQAASLPELAVALARAQNDAAALEQALRAASPAWTHSLHARAIERRRESNAPHDPYSGVLDAADLRAELRARFDARYPWSASQFNEWGACGFRFFADRLLRLQELAEPEEGLDAAQRGALYHAILEQTYKKFVARKLTVTPATLETARALLDETAAQVLETAPEQFGFRPTAWWTQERAEATRILHALLEAEAARADATTAQPYKLEQAFDVTLSLNGAPLRVRGILDRIDKRADGLAVVDYKSGSTKIDKREVYAGRNLQLPIYVMALRALHEPVADAYFLHIANGETSGAVDAAEREAWLAKARDHMARYRDAARQGNFAVKPSRLEDDRCVRYCDFAPLCRVGRWSVDK